MTTPPTFPIAGELIAGVAGNAVAAPPAAKPLTPNQALTKRVAAKLLQAGLILKKDQGTCMLLLDRQPTSSSWNTILEAASRPAATGAATTEATATEAAAAQ